MKNYIKVIMIAVLLVSGFAGRVLAEETDTPAEPFDLEEYVVSQYSEEREYNFSGQHMIVTFYGEMYRDAFGSITGGTVNASTSQGSVVITNLEGLGDRLAFHVKCYCNGHSMGVDVAIIG